MFDEPFVKNTLTPLLAITGTVLGLVGTILGILTYRLHRRGHKLDLTVGPRPYAEYSNDKLEVLGLSVIVANKSSFDVTISEIGLMLRRRFSFRTTIVPLYPKYRRQHKKKLPCRIAARDEHEIRFALSKQWFFAYATPTLDTILRSKCVVVTTAVGKRFGGTKPGFKQFIRMVKECDPSSLRTWED